MWIEASPSSLFSLKLPCWLFSLHNLFWATYSLLPCWSGQHMETFTLLINSWRNTTGWSGQLPTDVQLKKRTLSSPPRADTNPASSQQLWSSTWLNPVPKHHIYTFLNTSRNSDITSVGSLFQYLNILSVKKCFIISNLNLPWCNLGPFPLVLLLVTS